MTMMPRIGRNLGTVTAFVMGLAVLPAACGSDDYQGVLPTEEFLEAAPPAWMEEPVAPPVEVGSSLSGNYLAGRHAQAQKDVDTAALYILKALEMEPNNEDLLSRAFVLTTMAGQMDKAVDLANRLLVLDSQNPVANLLVSVDDMKKGRFAECEKRLAALSEERLSLLMTPPVRAWALVGLGKPDKALAALKPLKDKKLDSLYDLHAALINDVAGRPEAAAKHFRKTYDEDSNRSLRIVQLYGEFLERAGKRDEARKIYTDYQDSHPDTTFLDVAISRLNKGVIPERLVATPGDGVAEALFSVAGFLGQRETRETALVLGRMALWARPRFPIMQILVGDILEAEDRREDAVTVYSEIDPASPFSWTAKLAIAVNLDQLERFDEAAALLRSMAAEVPTQPQPLIELGEALRRRERYTEAVEAFDQALARIGSPRNEHWPLLYSRGMALERSHQWDRAEADFLAALELEPDQPFVLNYLGYSWIEQGRNIPWAEEMIRTAVEKQPRDGYIIDSLGWVYYRLGRYDEAVQQLERAVFYRPQDPVINDHLGDALWRVGRRQEARFQWKRALSLGPEPDQGPKIEAKLIHGLPEDVPVVGVEQVNRVDTPLAPASPNEPVDTRPEDATEEN